MTVQIEIQESRAGDLAALEKLYPEAFPDEDLLPLLRDLLAAQSAVLSLVARTENTLVGHVVFTNCTLTGRCETIALLGPLAVAPGRQRQGIGGALVREGFKRLGGSGVCAVCVLGDPNYYQRFGFAPAKDIAPPYPLPPAWQGAWQAHNLRGDTPPLAGTLSVPTPWRQPALWGP